MNPIERKNTGDFEIEAKKIGSKDSHDDSLLKGSSETWSNYNLQMTKWGLLEDDKEDESISGFKH